MSRNRLSCLARARRGAAGPEGEGKRERERETAAMERAPSLSPSPIPPSVSSSAQSRDRVCTQPCASLCSGVLEGRSETTFDISVSLSLSPPMCESTPAAGSSGSRFTLKTCCLPLVGREYQTLNTQRKAILPHRQSQRKAGNPTWFPDL